MSTSQYIEFIKSTLKTEGLDVADQANKIALAQKAITLDQYRAAARILVAAYLERE